MLRGKIHRATVTETRLDYEGSITIDQDLLDRAGIWVGEKVTIADVDNGSHVINSVKVTLELCCCFKHCSTRKCGEICQRTLHVSLSN